MRRGRAIGANPRRGTVQSDSVPVAPYVRQLRSRIGHDLLLLPTVAVLPIDAAGRVLLVKQADTGQWGTIGGSIDPDERPEEAALREAHEEAGVELELTGLLGVTGGPEYRITYPNGDEVACISIVYAAKVVGGEPRPDNDETTETGWFDSDELASADLNDFNRHLLNEMAPRLVNSPSGSI